MSPMSRKLTQQPPKVHPPKRYMDIQAPADFPVLGATMSPHATAYYENKATSSANLKKARHIPWRKILKRTALIILILVLITGGWVGFKFAHNFSKIFKGGLFSIFDNTQLNGEAQGRVNILLAGYSVDDPNHQGAQLTDSIMIVSVNTRNNTAFLLSVPRDLWVNIPGYSYQKINAAYEDGQSEHFSQSGYPNGGMGLLEEVINQDFGISINYYGLIDYTAFRDAVDAVGGININIQSPDPYGLYDPYTNLRLPNGPVTLDGQQALNLARARGDGPGAYGFPQGDFSRTANQRLMLVAIKNKALSVGVLSNPVKLSDLFDSLGNNVQTDFTSGDVLQLYNISKKINNNNITSIGLNNVNGKDLLQSYYTYNGEDALIPAAGLDNYSAIQSYVSQLTVVTSKSS